MSSPTASGIFRKAALERLSSPEQLDRLITVTKPQDWLAGAALLTVIALGLAWSVLGSVPVRVVGNGITIATGGRVLDATSAGAGTLVSILAPVGATVEKGDVVALVDNKDLRQDLASAEAVVAEQVAHRDALAIQAKADADARTATFAARRRALDARAADADARAILLEAEVKKEAAMFDRRLITWQVLNGSKAALTAARQEATEARTGQIQLDGDEVAARNLREENLHRATEAIAEARRRVAALSVQLGQRQSVTAPIAGRVVEWKASPGALVGAGQAVVGIESGTTGLELVLYLPPDGGKQVEPGMKVWVSPSTVKREEFGTLIGTVAEVSDFPATPQAMMSVLQNERLVQSLSPAGPPFASRVVLKRDPSTPSGYAWSSGRGPAVALTSGTAAEGDVTVESRAPITYVIPWMRKVAGVEG